MGKMPSLYWNDPQVTLRIWGTKSIAIYLPYWPYDTCGLQQLSLCIGLRHRWKNKGQDLLTGGQKLFRLKEVVLALNGVNSHASVTLLLWYKVNFIIIATEIGVRNNVFKMWHCIHHTYLWHNTHFTKCLWAPNWNVVQILKALIFIVMIQSGHNFAHVTTA